MKKDEFVAIQLGEKKNNSRDCERLPFAFELIAHMHVDVLSDPLLKAANLEPGINLMLQAGQRMVEKKRGRWHHRFFSSSVPLNFFFLRDIRAFLFHPSFLSVSLHFLYHLFTRLFHFWSFFSPLFLSTSSPPACVYFLRLSSLNKAATATGLMQILIISYTLRVQTCWALMCFYYRPGFIMFRWRSSLKSAWTISWNEGPAAMATIWWGRQGYLKEFSCCSCSCQRRSRRKDKEDEKKEARWGEKCRIL